MTPELVLRVLKALIDHAPLSDADLETLGLAEVALDGQRDALFRFVAELIAPPAEPDAQEVALNMLRSIWAAHRHILVAQGVDAFYPKPIVEHLIQERYITRSLSGYHLLPRGIDVLRQSELVRSNSNEHHHD